AESGAARAGLQEGDVLVSADGVPLRAEGDLDAVLALRAVGGQVELELLRGEQRAWVAVGLSARPSGPIGPLRDRAPYVGLAVEQTEGALAVRSVDPDSPAAR